jgi:hypothetical protein
MINISAVLAFIGTYPGIPLAVGFCLLLAYTIHLHHKIHSFTRGETGTSLEAVIKKCVASVDEIEKRNELIAEHALSLNNKVTSALRNAQTIRYKAFDANGSNQSFSVALLNEKGNGVVITSLHARDRMSTFAKPIEKYLSTYDLTEEELHVIEEAKKAHKGNQ